MEGTHHQDAAFFDELTVLLRYHKIVGDKLLCRDSAEADDDFAKDVSEFDTLEEYKADIKAKIKEEKMEGIKHHLLNIIWIS